VQIHPAGEAAVKKGPQVSVHGRLALRLDLRPCGRSVLYYYYYYYITTNIVLVII
jgi:hypothetical protein